MSVRAQWAARSFEFFHRNSNSNICLKNILYEYQPLFVGIFAAGQLPDFTYYMFDEYGHFVIYRLRTGLFHGFFLNYRSTFFCQQKSFSLTYYPFNTRGKVGDGRMKLWRTQIKEGKQYIASSCGTSLKNNPKLLWSYRFPCSAPKRSLFRFYLYNSYNSLYLNGNYTWGSTNHNYITSCWMRFTKNLFLK